MKKKLFLLIFLAVPASIFAQHIAIKNNILYDAILTPNLGIEAELSKKLTLDVIGNYNPFDLGKDKMIKHWLVQPEIRYWFCEKFSRGFVGLHAHGGQANIGHIKFPFGIYKKMNDFRHEADFYGGGISLGYQLPLHKRWNLEFSIGGGYAYVMYDKYDLETDQKIMSGQTHHYLGLTKATFSVIYIIK
jgi:hypothetical protein